MTAIGNLDLFLLAGFVGGIASFFRGFRSYRKYLLLQGTPTTPIRSIAMGLVRIHGKATGDHTIESPIAHTACCVYQIHIEKWKDQEDRGRWMHYGADTNGVSFHLEDSSGRVLVDPRGAEFDIESTAVREASSAQGFGGSDAELLAYVLRVGPNEEAPGVRHNFEAERGMFDIAEYAKQGATPDEMMRKLFPQVLESEAKTVQELEAEGPWSDPLREELRLAQIDLHKHPIWSSEYARRYQSVTKLQARVRKAGLITVIPPPPAKSAPPESSRPAGEKVTSIDGSPSAGPSSPRSEGSASAPSAEELVASIEGIPSARGRYRLTERCILPDHEYDVTGTCDENPFAEGADDRNLIRKGTNEPTFLISGLSRSDVNVMQKVQSYLMIFGGGMLAVFCLGILLLRFGQF